METNETNPGLAVYHRQQAMYHVISSMMSDGIIKDPKEFMTEFLPVFELLCDGSIRSSDKHIDKLTEEAREQIDKIRKGDT